MAIRFVVLGSDEEDEDGDLLHVHGEEEVHVQSGGCIVPAELEPNIRLTTRLTAPQSTAVAGSDLRMTALEAAMSIQSPGSITSILQLAVQDSTMQDSPASSEKRYSVPGMYRYCGHLSTIWQSD